MTAAQCVPVAATTWPDVAMVSAFLLTVVLVIGIILWAATR